MGTPAQRLESDRAKFPAMQVDEILVWKGWLLLHQQDYASFDYNLRIGDGTDPGPAVSEPYRTMSIQLSQLRLDAVGWRGNQPTIFEVERRAKPRSVGQLLTYDAVWRNQRLSSSPPQLTLVCADYNVNILQAIREAHIQLDVVPTVFSVLAPPAPGL